MVLDTMVASEISDRISEQHEKARDGRTTDPKGAVARRNQRREQRESDLGSSFSLGEHLSKTFNLSEEKEA
tara:strand:+ start:922 stop:1134 length:213 start_codon:yes stop_codon:yes gene_type:complete